MSLNASAPDMTMLHASSTDPLRPREPQWAVVLLPDHVEHAHSMSGAWKHGLPE